MRTRRVFLGVAGLAGVWAAAIAATGGFSVRLAGAQVSSHSARNPAWLALIAAAAAIYLARPAVAATLAADVRAGVRTAQRASPAAWIVAAGALLRIWYWLLVPTLWLDEEMIAINIRGRSLGELTGPLWLAQSAPLGWLATERIVGLMLGFGELALRAMPVAFGLATLTLAWWIGRRWMSAAGAAAFVFLMSFGEWVFYYSLELKHYSADTFFGLLLPALVVWALEGIDARERSRRVVIWWAVAVVAAWWSMGGLLVAPACALVLVAACWRRDGARAAVVAACIGVVWIALVALHYFWALRFAVGNSFLQDTWTFAMAPASANIAGRAIWVTRQASTLAAKPGGTGFALLFWVTAFCGLLLTRPRLLGVVFLTAPLVAAILGMVRAVPLYERFALWMTPALYFGVASALDAGVRWIRARPARMPAASAAGAMLSLAAIVVCADVGHNAYVETPAMRRGNLNHSLDDRAAVTWLRSRARGGDAVITTHLGLPAVWWYGGAAPVFEIAYAPPGTRCDALAWTRSLLPYTRALVYFGFRFDDVPKDFDRALQEQLRQLGSITEARQFGQSLAVIVDLMPAGQRALTGGGPAVVQPCLTASPAARW